MTEHPDLDLSAYLDGALSPGERAAVASHLDACARCRAWLADLRATSRLIAALPAPEPRRSLVPQVGRAPVWLRPVRLLGAIGSGFFVFAFLASAVINSGSSLGGGTTAAERLAEKGQFGAAVNALASDAAAQKAATAASAAPAPAAFGPSFDSTHNSAGTAATASPVGRADAASTTVPAEPRTSAGAQFGPPPLVFLGLALLFAVAAIVAHRRLRRT
ncbi:MAG TPA: zf-HC2 domain-containing protein [Candidatus Limnocylindria bacterium]|nr:zf-HC2 domain-containing protein [Candidatus Limnocylindria bacterium]